MGGTSNAKNATVAIVTTKWLQAYANVAQGVDSAEIIKYATVQKLRSFCSGSFSRIVRILALKAGPE